MSDDRRRERAQRLLRWYPAAWRERYGEEFTELLIAEIEEQPQSLTRTADVIRGGLLARAAAAGLSADGVGSEARLRASLGVAGWAAAGFLVFGIAVWSQLTVGWQWSAPASSSTTAAMLLMSGAVVGLLALAVMAVVPLLWATVRSGRGHLARPVLLCLAGVAVLVLGSLHFSHFWPGTGGHRWADRGLVPRDVGAWSWAASLWITSYWAHPISLFAFPPGQVVWMALSPVALAATAVGAVRTVRGLELSRATLRHEACLAAAATAPMAVFLAGAGSWVISGGAAPKGLFAVGAIDLAGVAVMAGALVASFRASQRALGAVRPLARPLA
jgi:hypothetical protein